MLFNSFEFLIFFPAVTLLYFILPSRIKWLLLLIASCIFYMYFIPIYILVLLLTIIVDYTAGILIEKAEGKHKRIFLIASIISNIIILGVFKYYNFINDNLTLLAKWIGWNYSIESLAIILPIGLSFHTFQSLSYVIEVYRGKQKAEQHFGIYALYVMFYPQLVAGPIERPQNLLPQFHSRHSFSYSDVASGLKLIMWGLFKKVVLADRLALLVNPVYANPSEYTAPMLVLATIFFTFQIYCDFSGYSDIALGTARVMGFRLMNNFDRPYASASIGEFWRRWHISLSTWFKDYVYVPLGGSKVSKTRWAFNIFATFLISGLWHGANWTFIIWGLLHGSFLVISGYFNTISNFICNRFLGRIIVMNVSSRTKVIFTFGLVSFAWIFFRADSVSSAFYISSHLFAFDEYLNVTAFKNNIWHLGLSKSYYITSVLLIAFMDSIERIGGITHLFSTKPVLIRWGLYYIIILFTVFFGVFQHSKFIYFQF